MVLLGDAHRSQVTWKAMNDTLLHERLETRGLMMEEVVLDDRSQTLSSILLL